MKKLITILLAVGMLHMSAYADVVLLDTECGTDGKVVMTGTLSGTEDTVLGLQVLQKGVEPDALTGDPAVDLPVTEFVDQLEFKAGTADFTYPFILPEGASGLRKARLTEQGRDEVRDFVLWYVKEEDYQAAAAQVNAARTGYEAFAAACNAGENLVCLGFDETVFPSLTSDAVLRIVYQTAQKKELDPSDRVETVRMWRAASLAAQCSRSGVPDLAQYGGCLRYYGDSVQKWVAFTAEDSRAAEQLAALLSGQEYSDLEQFEKQLKEALILTVTQYPNGVGNIGKILKDFSDLTGVTEDGRNDIYLKLAGKSYSSLSAFMADYNAFKNSGGSGSSGGSSSSGSYGGGSSGGGGSGSKSSNKTPPIAGAGTSTPVQPLNVHFIDLDMADWAYEAITALTDRGIINGKSETIFAPLDQITREEFVKIIVHAVGYEDRSASGGRFTDVVPGAWYERYVAIASEAGLVNGVQEDLFGVGSPISRQDMAVLIDRALRKTGIELQPGELTFTDADQIAAYAKDAVSALSGGGVINGMGDGSFQPTGTATRAEAAQIIYNMLRLH